MKLPWSGDLTSELSHLKVIAELGINHDGRLDLALDMVDQLAAGGVPAIKLQYRNLERAYRRESASPRELGDEIVGAELLRTHLRPEQLVQIMRHGRNIGVKVGISFFNAEDVGDFGDAILEFDFFKVPSVELENTVLIDSLLALDRIVLVSTGGHPESSIVEALSRIRSHRNWIPLHAVMNYPTARHNAQLGYIIHLKERWSRPVGYSSHDLDWEVCLLASSIGAAIIERHVTHQKTSPGLDHSSSSEVVEIVHLHDLVKDIELLSRRPESRLPNQGERINVQNLGRSYYARHDVSMGEILHPESFEYRGPRRGFGAMDAEKAWGQIALRNLPQGTALARIHLEGASILSRGLSDWANEQRIGIPVRPGDWTEMHASVPLNTLEFHLSFNDVEKGLSILDLPAECAYSIHLPDYVSPTDLLNPHSNSSSVRNRSNIVLEACMRFAQQLQELTGEGVPVVGSFPYGSEGMLTRNFFEAQRDLVARWARKDVSLLHQWLPPFAWYFGGSARLSRFNSMNDLHYCSEFELPICLDTAHTAMSLMFEGVSVREFLGVANPLISHIHIAGSAGIDAEGIPLESADGISLELIDCAMRLPTSKILERWQGHLEGGRGFIQDLHFLRYGINSQSQGVSG